MHPQGFQYTDEKKRGSLDQKSSSKNAGLDRLLHCDWMEIARGARFLFLSRGKSHGQITRLFHASAPTNYKYFV